MWAALKATLGSFLLASMQGAAGLALRQFVLSLSIAWMVYVFIFQGPLFDALLGLLPPDQVLQWSPFIEALEVANYYLPVAETIAALLLVGTLNVGFWALRIVLKMIPTLSF